MSFYDDYVADGLCCQSCGSYIGDEPGYPRFCYGCDPERQKPKKAQGDTLPKGRDAKQGSVRSKGSAVAAPAAMRPTSSTIPQSPDNSKG